MKLLGHLVIIDVPEGSHNWIITDCGNLSNDTTMIDCNGKITKDKFSCIGTYYDIVAKGIFEHVITNHYIDYNDLSLEFVNPLMSFNTFMEYYQISKNSLFLTYADFKSTFYSITTLPKMAVLEPHANTLFTQVDKDLQKYIVNQYKVPIDFGGYYLYDLNNFRLNPGVFYAIKSEDKYIVRNTSIDINVDKAFNGNRKKILYKQLIDKQIIILPNG